MGGQPPSLLLTFDERDQRSAEDDGDVVRPQSARFWTEVRALPPRQRAAVALYYLEDLPLVEVAEVLECSVGTVKGQLFDARRSLANKLGAQEVVR